MRQLCDSLYRAGLGFITARTNLSLFAFFGAGCGLGFLNMIVVSERGYGFCSESNFARTAEIRYLPVGGAGSGFSLALLFVTFCGNNLLADYLAAAFALNGIFSGLCARRGVG